MPNYIDKYYFILWPDTKEVSITKASNILETNVAVGELCNVSAAGKVYEGRAAATGKYNNTQHAATVIGHNTCVYICRIT